jgi:hypothetical protein
VHFKAALRQMAVSTGYFRDRPVVKDRITREMPAIYPEMAVLSRHQSWGGSLTVNGPLTFSLL